MACIGRAKFEHYKIRMQKRCIIDLTNIFWFSAVYSIIKKKLWEIPRNHIIFLCQIFRLILLCRCFAYSSEVSKFFRSQMKIEIHNGSTNMYNE